MAPQISHTICPRLLGAIASMTVAEGYE